jgi:hypothetical protein
VRNAPEAGTIAAMEPGRFDDVEIRFVEDPEPPRRAPSLRRRMTVAMTATILGAGVLAAGASALTESEQAARGAASEGKAPSVQRNHNGVPFTRSGHRCHRGEGRNAGFLSQSDL